MIELRWGSATDVGLVRANNQDELLVAPPLFAVADGMGGAAAGEVASALAVENLRGSFSSGRPPGTEATHADLVRATEAANRAVWQQAASNPEMRGMGTTLVALASVAGDRLAAVNVGDSRMYLLRHGELRQVTEDHSLVAELVAEGQLSPEEAELHPRRNIMTRALGVEPEVMVDLFMLEPERGDRLLLCSDGLPRELSDSHIASLMRRLESPSEVADELVAEAKRRGGNDNITVVVVDVVGLADQDGTVPAAAPSPEAVADEPGPIPDEPGPPPDRPAHAPKARLFTVRVVAFILVLVLLIAAAGAAVTFYSRDAWFVGLDQDYLTVYQGRPGGFLWFHPTVAKVTDVTVGQVEPRHLLDLLAGQAEPSKSAAIQYVTSLYTEEKAAQNAALPPSTGPSSTVPPSSSTSKP